MENFPTIWVTDICDELNRAGFVMDGKRKFDISRVENSIELMKMYVTINAEMYEHLDAKGLVNRGYCPITGEKIGTANLYQIFGRKVYISAEGEKIAKERDSKLHIDTFGKEPMTEGEKSQAYEYFRHEKQSANIFNILLLLLLLLGLIYIIKKC